MNRKTFLTLLGCGFFAAPGLWAQQADKVFRIGMLLPQDAPASGDDASGVILRAALRDHGWIEGRNLIFERRWAGVDPRRQREVAAELKALQVALIVTVATTAIRAARDGAPGVPIVMVNAGDPVGAGFVRSLARPGGDLTGTSAAGEEILAKQLEFLSVAAPRAKTVTVLMNSANPANGFFFGALAASAKLLGLQLDRIDVALPEELDAAIRRAKGGALLVLGDPMFNLQLARITEQALRSNVPSVYGRPEYVRAGGLMSYLSSEAWHWRTAASYVDKILKGEKPADLPVQQPTRFDFVINMKTAKALGLTIPPSLMLRATEIIE